MRLQVLWISRSGVEDLHGLGALPALRELYASFNDITDLAPLADSEAIECVDLEALEDERLLLDLPVVELIQAFRHDLHANV